MLTNGSDKKIFSSLDAANLKYQKEVVIPGGIEGIGGGCFYSNYNLEKIIFPNSLKRIAISAFEGCSNLKEVVFPSGVEEIADCAFKNCYDLKKITFPNTLKRIEGSAFWGCHDLKEVILPEGLEFVGYRAFGECINLIRIELPSTLKKIGEEAFNTEWVYYETTPTGRLKVKDGMHVTTTYESKIKRILLPSTIEEIGEQAFGSYSLYQGRRSHKVHYFAPRASVAARHVAGKCGFVRYETNVTKGTLIGAPIVGTTLYYADDLSKKVQIPEEITKIAECAFWGCTQMDDVFIPRYVVEIGARAFSAGGKISNLSFAPQSRLKKIGSKAFENLVGCPMIDLPSSVEELAPDAFPKGCVVSVGGRMPSYRSDLAKLNKVRDDIKSKKKEKEELSKALSDAEDALQTHLNAFPNEVNELSELYKERMELEEKKKEKISDLEAKREAVKGRIAEVTSRIDSLTLERDRCFFFSFSKRRELLEEIERNRAGLQNLENELGSLTYDLKAARKEMDGKIEAINSKILPLGGIKSAWNSKKDILSGEKRDISNKIAWLSSDIVEMENALLDDEKLFKEKNAEWEQRRNKTIRKIEEQKRAEEEQRERERIEREAIRRKNEIEREKKSTLEMLVVPESPKKISTYCFKPRKNVVEEELLNEGFLQMINDANEKERVTVHNRVVSSNLSKIERIKEINEELGLDPLDRISHLKLLDVPKIRKSYVPERFAKLTKIFAAFDFWKRFKDEAQNVFQDPKETKALGIGEKYFSSIEHLVLTNKESSLLVFPYCIAIYKEGEPIRVFTYDDANVSVEYFDAEEITDTVDEFGELIKEQYKYLNKDGSVSRRYRDNPLIKTVRYTTVTVSSRNDRFEFPTRTYNAALNFETIFKAYCRDITSDLMGNVYGLVLRSAEIADIEVAIDDLAKEEKRRRELEAQRAEEERQRLEAEQKAAAEEAERKRQELIQRQRELNEERRRHAEEKKKALQLFEDDFSEEKQTLDEGYSDSIQERFSVVGNATISNNVFKVVLRQIAQFEANEFIVCFVSDTGDVISNKKKLVSADIDSETTLGFVLVSGIDYTQMKKCAMKIMTADEDIQSIEFKMNIAFYSDF